LLCAVLAGPAVFGCSRHETDQEEQRRALLTPPDNKREREEAARKKQVFDEDGDLIPSEQSVAGLLLPRGLTPSMHFEREWYFRSMEIPAEALERYFIPRVLTGAINHSQGGATEFVAAKIKDNPSAPPVTIRIVKLSGANSASELYIRQSVPAPLVRPKESEVEAQLKARREHAD
jgi:hypothetical protein